MNIALLGMSGYCYWCKDFENTIGSNSEFLSHSFICLSVWWMMFILALRRGCGNRIISLDHI